MIRAPTPQMASLALGTGSALTKAESTSMANRSLWETDILLWKISIYRKITTFNG
jgi:hypothetical protein